jgi:hypothetical protein
MGAERKVAIEFTDEQVTALFNLLEKEKETHPELHEVVFQGMTKALMSRI